MGGGRRSLYSTLGVLEDVIQIMPWLNIKY